MIGNVFDLQHLIIREFAQRWHHHLKSHFCIYKQSIIKPVVIHINSPIAALRNPGRQACTKRHTQQFIFVSSAPPILVLPQPWCTSLGPAPHAAVPVAAAAPRQRRRPGALGEPPRARDALFCRLRLPEPDPPSAARATLSVAASRALRCGFTGCLFR